jgi:UDP-glucose 4-epimerase
MARVLVTGGAGYIGSFTARRLAAKGFEVIILDNLRRGSVNSLDGLPIVIGSISNQRQLHELLRRGVDAVVHFAAFSQVAESLQFPERYFRNNVSSGMRLLDAMVSHGVKQLVFSSSAAVYGNPLLSPIPESHPLHPVNPYGESKAIFENILKWYEVAHGLNYVALRYFNAAGGSLDGKFGECHDPETHLIPSIMLTALGKRKVFQVHGDDYDTPDGTAIRDFVHVEDLASAHVLAVQALLDGQPSSVYNVGTGTGCSVKEVLVEVGRCSGRDIPHVIGPRRNGDPPSLVADPTKLRTTLNWTPQFSSLSKIVETAWNWHSSHPNGYENYSP